MKTYEPKQVFTEVPVDKLLDKIKEMKEKGYRLIQLFATVIYEGYEISYCFDTGEYCAEIVKTELPFETLVPSISEYYPYALPYENEACELFGVKINVPIDGFKHKLYKIEETAPYVSDYM